MLTAQIRLPQSWFQPVGRRVLRLQVNPASSLLVELVQGLSLVRSQSPVVDLGPSKCLSPQAGQVTDLTSLTASARELRSQRLALRAPILSPPARLKTATPWHSSAQVRSSRLALARRWPPEPLVTALGI